MCGRDSSFEHLQLQQNVRVGFCSLRLADGLSCCRVRACLAQKTAALAPASNALVIHQTATHPLRELQMIRQQLQHLKACGYVTQDLLASGGNAVTTWNPQEDHTSFGRAAFGRDGLLLEAQRQQLLGADAAAKAGLVDAFISGQPLPQHQGSLLPVFQHGRGREVTSCQNVVVMKGSRVRVLMLPFSARLLHEVVMTCKRKAQELSGYSLEQEALDVSAQCLLQL